jgi:hypothetical protein
MSFYRFLEPRGEPLPGLAKGLIRARCRGPSAASPGALWRLRWNNQSEPADAANATVGARAMLVFSEAVMRIVTIFAVLVAVLCVTARAAPAQAREYPWCARYDVWTYNCGFVTFQQCLATISGAGGICTPNPRAVAINDERPLRQKRARAKY